MATRCSPIVTLSWSFPTRGLVRTIIWVIVSQVLTIRWRVSEGLFLTRAEDGSSDYAQMQPPQGVQALKKPEMTEDGFLKLL